MTKDRRLGRGLAALLGTPVDEVSQPTAPNQFGNASNASSPASNGVAGRIGPVDNVADRNETIRQLSNQAHAEASDQPNRLAPITIPMTPPVASSNVSHATSGALEIPVTQIDANPFQPRRQFSESELESLAESIKEHKQLQPILVRKVGERYQLISGERRLRATVRAGLPTIRAEVRIADDRLVAELAIIENLQRKDLNAIEKALSFKRYLTEHRCTQDELAKRLKIDRSTIANMMRLLELPDAITDAVQREEISAGHAKALLSLGSIKEQLSYVQKIRDEGWSVRETEARVAEAVAAASESEDGVLAAIPRRKATKTDQLAALERELKMHMGTRVDISQTSRGRGRVTIHFTSIEEFERIRSILSGAVSRSQRAA